MADDNKKPKSKVKPLKNGTPKSSAKAIKRIVLKGNAFQTNNSSYTIRNLHQGIPSTQKNSGKINPASNISCNVSGAKYRKVDEKERTVENRKHGSNSIKREIRFIVHEVQELENILRSPKHGLKEIKREVRNIEDAVSSPIFGLAEIKQEVAAIEKVVSTQNLSFIVTELANIEAKLDSPTFGLAEIKTEVFQILQRMGAGS